MTDFGINMFPTDKAINPMILAKEAEDRGFESIWFPEHSHIPTSRETPWGLNPKAPPLPEEYWRTHDQFIALGMAGAVTSKIKLGTGITLVPQRDPIWLAKSVATVDALTDGRFLFGIGYGGNKEELHHHGVKFGDRRAVMRERILAMKEIWANDEAEFHGEHVEFSSSWQWPKPTQKPHPPIILGGAAGPKTMKDIIEYCDGFMPISGRYDFAEQINTLKQMAEDAGRDPESFDFGQFGTPPKAEVVDTLIEAGCNRVGCTLPPADADTVIPKLDQISEFKDQYK